MRALTCNFKAPAWMLAGFFVLSLSIAAIAQQETPAESKASASKSDVVESAANAIKPTPVKIVRSPWMEKLHQEREAGNMDVCRRMETQAWKPQTVGEAACDILTMASTTIGGQGDLKQQLSGEPMEIPTNALSQASFGGDTRVREMNKDSKEYGLDMTSDSQGNLYVVWEDDSLTYTYLQVYRSIDGGRSWFGFGYVIDYDHDLRNPSIAVGEDSGGGSLLLAYIVMDEDNIPYPEVATCPLPPTPWHFTVHAIPFYSAWESYSAPRIVTDSHIYHSWYAYLTCEGVYDGASGNVNVCTWRSTDGGATWIDSFVAFGNTDEMYWDDPDITFGTLSRRVLIVTHNRDLNSIYTLASDSFGSSWNAEVLFSTMTEPLPYWISCQPKIAAARDHDNVMICCNKVSTNYDSLVIGQGYSQDAGETWSTLWEMDGSGYYDEYTPALIANEGGGSWHVTWSVWQEHSILHNQRPQDLSDYWQKDPKVISDTCTASVEPLTSLKGIACNWASDAATITWSDFRDGTPDYDCFADSTDNIGLMTDRTGIVDTDGGTVNFYINSGASNAGRYYAILGSATGTSPGTTLPGGQAVLPINWDVITDFVLGNANVSYMFIDFIGITDASGSATARLNCPPVPGYADVELYFAYAHNKPYDFASNAVTVQIISP